LGTGGRAQMARKYYAVAMPIEAKSMAPDLVVLEISGRLVMGKEVGRLEAVVKEQLEKGSKKFVFDLSNLEYTDSSGIGSLVSCLTAIRKSGGELRMAGVNERIQRLFQITGVNHLMAVYPTVAAAAVAE
jgi:anti-sigma B factor antagonist